MPVDFNRLVLAPAMDAFARKVVIIPVESQGNRSALYKARGDYRRRPMDVQTEGGAILSTEAVTLAVRKSEFATPPSTGDEVLVPLDAQWDALGVEVASLDVPGTLWHVWDDDEDAEGNLVLTLKSGEEG